MSPADQVRHRLRTTRARARFLACIDKDGSRAQIHDLVTLAFERGTAALGAALDDIGDRVLAKQVGKRQQSY